MLSGPKVFLPRNFIEEKGIALPAPKDSVFAGWNIVERS
jgi:hypothetical protein